MTPRCSGVLARDDDPFVTITEGISSDCELDRERQYSNRSEPLLRAEPLGVPAGAPSGSTGRSLPGAGIHRSCFQVPASVDGYQEPLPATVLLAGKTSTQQAPEACSRAGRQFQEALASRDVALKPFAANLLCTP